MSMESSQFDEPCSFYCCTGFGGRRLPHNVVAAWDIGMKRIMLIGDIGNWARYTFLAVQSFSLLVAIIVSLAIPKSVPFYNRNSTGERDIQVVLLSVAVAINLAERVLFLTLRKLTNLPIDFLAWNFRADIIRLIMTEILIYFALMIIVFTTFRSDAPNIEDGAYAILALISFVYFITAVVMKMFIIIKFSHSLLKSRVANYSRAAISQKFLLYWLCLITFTESALQVLLVIVNGASEISVNPVYILALFFAGIVPVGAWGLSVWIISPWLRFFPLSMALDLPSTPNCPEEIDIQAISQFFHQIYHDSMTCPGITMNLLRHYTKPLFVILHFIFPGPCIILLSTIWIYAFLYQSAFHMVLTLFSCILLSFLSLPSVVFAVGIYLAIPSVPFWCPTLLYFFFCSRHRDTYKRTFCML